MFRPALSVGATASYMCILPGDAHSEHLDRLAAHNGHSTDEPALSRRCSEMGTGDPGSARPGDHFPALALDGVAPVGATIDPMRVLVPIVERILGGNNDVRIKPNQMAHRSFVTSTTWCRPFKVPGGNSQRSVHRYRASTLSHDNSPAANRFGGAAQLAVSGQ